MSKKNREPEVTTMPETEMPVEPTAGQQLVDQVAAVPESKASKFTRLANKRVNNALKTIGYVKNLASKNTYEYTPEQAAAVVDALLSAANDVKHAFNGQADTKKLFSL